MALMAAPAATAGVCLAEEQVVVMVGVAETEAQTAWVVAVVGRGGNMVGIRCSA